MTRVALPFIYIIFLLTTLLQFSTVFIASPLTEIAQDDSFLSQQLKFERVRDAEKEKGQLLADLLQKNRLRKDSIEIMMVHIKEEEILEVYAKPPAVPQYQILKTYKVCARSGELGPKNQEGDEQVPEGRYHIAHFNPKSNFHLSLGLNYPNKEDRKRSKAQKLGGDIYIHGDCVTIGCLPMTDDLIKEIYLLAVYAKSSGQKEIPVYLFPFRMTTEKMQRVEQEYAQKSDLLVFWRALQHRYNEAVSLVEKSK
ncbi:MAG: L,D-transpeptidase family protein [Chloroherpetonaceae bacterium]|nr:L,D-transpeptidase family protein [Chloroherpetonaceae bacterium]